MAIKSFIIQAQGLISQLETVLSFNTTVYTLTGSDNMFTLQTVSILLPVL
jgi:hypothetical protein